MQRKVRQRAYHHGDLKRALVEASIELILDEGVEALTVAEVGRRLGVSSGAPYKHFADRPSLLRAVAAEGNRRLNEAIAVAMGQASDPHEGFRLSGVAYVRWAAENPALYRIATDPLNIDYASAPPPEEELPEGQDSSMATFWPELGNRVRSGAALTASDPLVKQLRGRALAEGLASFFVRGVFSSLGISSEEAERITRAVTEA